GSSSCCAVWSTTGRGFCRGTACSNVCGATGTLSRRGRSTSTSAAFGPSSGRLVIRSKPWWESATVSSSDGRIGGGGCLVSFQSCVPRAAPPERGPGAVLYIPYRAAVVCELCVTQIGRAHV